jgi:hypothetical protein
MDWALIGVEGGLHRKDRRFDGRFVGIGHGMAH